MARSFWPAGRGHVTPGWWDDTVGPGKAIDTDRVGVHIFSGEYDYSGTVERGREAHEAIPGSTFTEMPGMGHFPMSEHPQAFMEYLQPVLDQVVQAG